MFNYGGIYIIINTQQTMEHNILIPIKIWRGKDRKVTREFWLA